MGNKKDIESIKKEHLDQFSKLYKELGANRPPEQIFNEFIINTLADMELRLRNLERAQGRADDYLNMHTPLI